MAVRIRFDEMHNAIQPTLVLATRGGKKLGIIHADGINFDDHMTSGYELQFRVHREESGVRCNLWDDIVDLRLVWCPEWDIWFEISVEINEQDETIKNINAISVGEAELSQINLYDIEINTEDDISRDEYVPTVLYNSSDTNGSLLHRILEKAPHYTIGHVDASIAGLQRTFQFSDTTIYDALQEISKEIDCVFIIDSGSDSNGKIARRINAYDLCTVCLDCGERGRFSDVCPECGSSNLDEGYGEDTNIFVSVENLADEVTFTTDKDSVKNCFRMVAGDDMMTAAIRSCNPNGSNYIWNITGAVINDMSDELRAKLSDYDAAYKRYKDENTFSLNSAIVNSYNNIVTKYRTFKPDIETVSGTITGHSGLIAAYYNALDLRMYLENTLMPDVSMSSTTATAQAALLTRAALSPVAVNNVAALSEATASSAVLLMAKTVINPNYQVKIKTSGLSNRVWTGSFTVTNYSDDSDTADSATITVDVNGDYATFVKQRLKKTLSEQSDDPTSITALFGMNPANFNAEIKKYCLDSLVRFNDICTACLNIMIEQGVTDQRSWGDEENLYSTLYEPYYNKQSALQNEIKTRENEIAVVDGVYDENGAVVTAGIKVLIEDQIRAVQSALDFETFVGSELMKELAAYRREDTYENSNYVSTGLNNAEIIQNAMEFIKTAEQELIKSSTLQHSITSSLRNLLVMKEFASLLDHFATGNWIRIRVDDSIYKLRLVGYGIDFDDLENLSVEFSDVLYVASGATDIESILSKAASMATSYDAVTRQASKGADAKANIDGWVSRGLSLTKMKILDNAANQNIQIDENGLLCREYLQITDTYDPKQLKIINRGLYVTDDAWRTFRAGIGDFVYYDPSDGTQKEAYGVIADTLVGNLILSEKVGVYNKTGSIKLDEDGLTLISKASGVANVFKIQREATNGALTDVIYFDNTGDAHFDGILTTTALTATDYIYMDGQADSFIKVPMYPYDDDDYFFALSNGGLEIHAAGHVIYNNGSEQSIGPIITRFGSNKNNYLEQNMPYPLEMFLEGEEDYVKAKMSPTELTLYDCGELLSMTPLQVRVGAGGHYAALNANASQNYAAIGTSGNIIAGGNLTVSGTKSRVAKTDQYFERLLYCYETPSPTFGDIGEGIIANDGKCYIPLDAIFAQTITTIQYQVSLQKYGNGDCWVSERNGAYFIVEGTPGLSFGWEIKAKQRDYDQLRLEKNEEKFTVPAQTYGADAAEHIKEIKEERNNT